jgi:hypothetical protein
MRTSKTHTHEGGVDLFATTESGRWELFCALDYHPRAVFVGVGLTFFEDIERGNVTLAINLLVCTIRLRVGRLTEHGMQPWRELQNDTQ